MTANKEKKECYAETHEIKTMPRTSLMPQTEKVLFNHVALNNELTAAAEGNDDPETIIEVLPPPVNGVITNRGGREFTVQSMSELVYRLNNADPKIRLDVEHETEPSSPNFRGYTGAQGWFKENGFHINARGGISGIVHRANSWLLKNLYRYVSPTLLIKNGEIISMSSIALTNAPLLELKEFNSSIANPENQETPTMSVKKTDTETAAQAAAAAVAAAEKTPTVTDQAVAAEAALNAARAADLDKRTVAVAEREKAAETTEREAFSDVLEGAVNSGTIFPAEKEGILQSVDSHKDGYAAGIIAAQSLLTARAPTVADQAALTQRTAGHTATMPVSNSGLNIKCPSGFEVDQQSVALDVQIRAHMAATGETSYEVALEQVVN